MHRPVIRNADQFVSIFIEPDAPYLIHVLVKGMDACARVDVPNLDLFVRRAVGLRREHRRGVGHFRTKPCNHCPPLHDTQTPRVGCQRLSSAIGPMTNGRQVMHTYSRELHHKREWSCRRCHCKVVCHLVKTQQHELLPCVLNRDDHGKSVCSRAYTHSFPLPVNIWAIFRSRTFHRRTVPFSKPAAM